MIDIDSHEIHSPRMRRAGKGLLSLALMDARNHSLRWSGVFEAALGTADLRVPQQPGLDSPLWLLGHIGWFQERWIVRNVQRQRGTRCDPSAPRLASVRPDADACWDPSLTAPSARWQIELPDLPATRQYLADTIEITLELLENTPDDDEALYFFRLALFREDMLGETLAETAQALDLASGDVRGLVRDMATMAPREPLLFPATRWLLGSPPGGFVFDNEKWAHEVAVPEFEIDAQPVTWSAYAEFVEDGGYDDERWWGEAGRIWLQRAQRRAPRYVEQLRRGVLQRRFGRATRVPMAQPVLHVSWHEADAWCRWAGRRLPTEVEWEAASQAASRGFAWGSAWEWTATTFRPYPGFSTDPWAEYSQPCFGTHKVLRGASPATRPRMRHTRFRRFEPPERDAVLGGFRSCAV